MRSIYIVLLVCGGSTLLGCGAEPSSGSPFGPWGPTLEPGDGSGSDDGGSGGADGSGTDDDGHADDESGGETTAEPWEPDPDGPAFLHADVWSVFWNDRTRCGAERTFLEVCQRRGEGECGSYEAAYAACDPAMIVYGQVGPEQQGNELCSRGNFPDIGGCVAANYDFDALRFHWYGAEWQGNWPAATLKIFDVGADWTGGGELVAMSNLPGRAQAAMSGIENHGLGWGCAMQGETSGDGAFQRPFGGFAWVEVPTEQTVTVVAAAATNFADQPFQGCGRGQATQDPWITGTPGSTLGCVYVQDFRFEPGHHYAWRYGQIVELEQPGPPVEIVEGFASPQVGVDVSTPDACAL